ncbi:MAG: C-type lectin domain-containing protein [Pseudomonadota bacterium]
MQIRYVILAVIAGFLCECSSNSDSVCAAGATQACFCPNGEQGAQTCSDDGLSWGTCSCCQCIPDGGASCQPTDDGSTPNDGGALTGEPVYASFPGGLTWTAAEEKCMSRGGHLAWITTEKENKIVLEVCEATRAQGCYIGLKYPYKSWESGIPVSYTNWHPEDFKNLQDGQTWMFTSLKYGADKAGMWDDGDFTGSSEPYVCRVPADADLSNAIAVRPVSGSYGHIIAAFEKGLGWTLARNACAKMGGDLVWITNEEENALVLEVCEMTNAQGCSIGLRYPYKSWVTGLPVTFTNWNPDDFSDTENEQVWIYTRLRYGAAAAGTWDDADLEKSDEPYVCRVPNTADVSAAFATRVLPK